MKNKELRAMFIKMSLLEKRQMLAARSDVIAFVSKYPNVKFYDLNAFIKIVNEELYVLKEVRNILYHSKASRANESKACWAFFHYVYNTTLMFLWQWRECWRYTYDDDKNISEGIKDELLFLNSCVEHKFIMASLNLGFVRSKIKKVVNND